MNTHNKKAAAFLCSVSTGSCELNSGHHQAEGKKGLSMRPVCVYSTPDHAQMGWYLKVYWLNEFPQDL